jgi:23S rRNA (uracil1939-C5)-methyltransferase
MGLTCSPRRWEEAGEAGDAPDGFALGLHVPGRHRKVIDLSRCEIQFEEANAIMTTVRRLAVARGLSPWDPIEHTGLLRHLVLRKGFHTGEIMVNLVTSEQAADRIDPLAQELLAEHPEITTLVHSVTARRAVVAIGESESGGARFEVTGVEVLG